MRSRFSVAPGIRTRHRAAVLSVGELERFRDDGFVVVREAFPRALALACRDDVARHLNITDDPGWWTEPVLRGFTQTDAIGSAARSPRLESVVEVLLAGEAWHRRPNLGAFVVRFPSEVDPGDAGWHIDGSFQPTADAEWHVNAASKGRGLLLLCLLSDVTEDDAPTRIAVGSHHEMPRLLAPFGDVGVQSLYAPLPEPREVVLATGSSGDVFVCHPFLDHAASWPHRGASPRYVSQPSISIDGPLRLDGADLSPVAQVVRDALDG